MIQVLVVDDHTIFRSGVRRLLLDEADMCVAAEASNGHDAMKKIANQSFDLVLMDINMEGRSGLEVLTSIRNTPCPPPVLMLSMYPEEQYALIAIQAGAKGYIAKDAEPAELVGAIRCVAAGGQYLSTAAAMHVRDQLSGQDMRPAHQRLSVREHQIMLMLIKGMAQTEIGEEMMISAKTVNTHRMNLMEKLGVANTAELVLYAVRNGLAH